MPPRLLMLDTQDLQDHPQPTDRRGFAQNYTPAGAFDEMLEADGALRAHWRMFVSMLDDLGPEDRRRRWEQARRLIHENGITHNVYGASDGLDRPWSLDFIPQLIPAAEWNAISAGLTQRAHLLDRLLADLYGPMRTVTEGLLPPELVHANPGFLRPAHGIDLIGDRRLHLYAADLSRRADGTVEVLSDRTQAPSGAGYTLENRIVLSRVLPTIFRQCYVQRLAPFFVSMRQMLTALAPANRDNPRVVLLTPGPYNETYFEHAYLARYLGYTLVQGNDLTVRDARVYLKTLGGLQRVDVILRRVDDDFCDPLELYPNSFLGVPGLLQAVREGNVGVANAIGSGILQGPGFMPFLPQLCRFFLGQDLLLPSVESWWCGDPMSRQYVLDNLHELVVKPAYPTRGSDPVFGGEQTREQLTTLAARINAEPDAFVAQRQVMAASTPAMVDETVEPRRYVMRAYLSATTDNSYGVMPGGLTRITSSFDSRVVSLQKGGGSKDIWVLAEGPVSEVTLLNRASELVPLSRGGGDLPSRIADDLFWLGRYVQRGESIVRLARGTLSRLIDQSSGEESLVVRVLADALLGHPLDSSDGQFDRDLLGGLFSQTRGDHLRATVASVHRLARLLRDRISVDAWRILQAIEGELARFDVAPEEPSAGVTELLDRLISSFAAFVGLSTDSMTRGQAWRFLDMGHRVERATTVTKLLRDTLVHAPPDEPSLLEAVLEIADSSLTYRRRYLTFLEVHAIVDLLLCDETNPRSVAYQLAAIDQHLSALPRESMHPHDQPDRQMLLRMRTNNQLVDIQNACVYKDRARPALGRLLGDTLDHLSLLSVAIGQIYFTHAAVPRGLIGTPQEGMA